MRNDISPKPATGKIKVSFCSRLATDFIEMAANDNDPKGRLIAPLEELHVTEELEKAVGIALFTLRLPRRRIADRIAHAIYWGPCDIRYPDGSSFVAGYDIDTDLSSDWTFTWLKDLIASARGRQLPPLTDLMKRRLNLIVLWLMIDHPIIAQSLPIRDWHE